VDELRVELPADESAGEIQPYSVLPSPYPVLGFQYRGSLSVFTGASLRALFPAGITGLQSEARWFVPEKGTHSILLRLKPASAVSLFGVNMRELAGAHVGFDELMHGSAARELQERVRRAHSALDAANDLQRFLTRLVARQRRPAHPTAVLASGRILRAAGNVRIGALAAEASISERHLERVFLSEIGVTPKEFASLCRFDWVVRNAARGKSWADLAAEAGYSDQAHLIRSFASRAGFTPAKLAVPPEFFSMSDLFKTTAV
jgi:AraC-like DNA-binding protein